MELEFWGIVIAVIFFVVGLKVAKWIMWSISILLILIAGWMWIF